jgi:hypothetical protein
MLNKENMNCLDVAIKYEQREVIKVLLDSEYWYKLIRTHNLTTFDYDDYDDNFKIVTIIPPPQPLSPLPPQPQPLTSTLNALYKKQFWDIIKLILDKCKINEKEINFSIIDPPSNKSMSKHSLMLIARSGQESLIKHEVTNLLVKLKWRLVPRFAFYFNLFIYLLYLFLFTWYIIDLSTIETDNNTNNNNNNSIFIGLYKSRGSKTNQNNIKNKDKRLNSNKSDNFYSDMKESLYYHINKSDKTSNDLLIFLTMFQLLKEILIIIYLDGTSYFLSLQNLTEMSTYIMSLISLLSIYYYTQSNFGSIAILFSYILLPIFLQKFKSIGVYVITLKRTIFNTTKLFPVFLILFMGFVLSFKVRESFGVDYSDSSDSFTYSMIRTVTMVIGELDSSKMGLDDDDSLPNLIIYFLFIGLMCTIVLNLLGLYYLFLFILCVLLNSI